MRLLKIGRDNACDIVLHSNHVSSLHAELVLLDNGDMELEDKGSKNGTFIMNQPIAPGKAIKVNRGDAIRFGDTELQWSQVPMPEDNSAYKALWGIGTNLKNDLQLSGATVSRYHATVKLGRDGKMYIVDHSKNGTTVNGQKITSHNPYRIRRKDAIVCGGVPVDTSGLPWPTDVLSTILKVAAAVIIVCGVGFGVYKIITIDNREWDAERIAARYSSSTAIIYGKYHYEISDGGTGILSSITIDRKTPPTHFLAFTTSRQIKEANKVIEQKLTIAQYHSLEIWPEKTQYGQEVLFLGSNNPEALAQFTDIFEYSGTAFFISPDGKMITNLHVVKPWLFEEGSELQQLLQVKYRKWYQDVAFKSDLSSVANEGQSEGFQAYTSEISAIGKLDGLYIIPNGKVYSTQNTIKCRVLSAGDDPQKDVALIQVESGELPHGASYVNVADSMDVDEDHLVTGREMFVIGFPLGDFSYVQENEMSAICNDGKITQTGKEFNFMYNAETTGGASGSPVFNNKGYLIGVHYQGLSRAGIQGYNQGMKAKYVKELLDSPYKK